MENFLEKKKEFDSGAVHGAAGEGKVAYVAVRDIAEVVGQVLLHDDKWNAKTTWLTGPRAVSESEAIAAISKSAQKDAKYVNMPPAEFQSRLEGFGLPKPIIEMVMFLENVKANNWSANVATGVQDVLGRPATSFEEWAEENQNSFRDPYVLHYFGVKARAFWPLLVASVGGVPVEWNRDVKWPDAKPTTPFGQLPLLTGPGGFKMGQSLAIGRFLARKGKIVGTTDCEFTMSEQLIQWTDDLNNTLGKAHAAPNRTEAMDALFATGLKPQLDYVAALLKGPTFTGRLLAGDLAVFATFDFLVTLQSDCLDSHPSLKAFYNHVGQNDKVKAITSLQSPMYFKRKSDS
jgi:glutathione S-transferase